MRAHTRVECVCPQPLILPPEGSHCVRWLHARIVAKHALKCLGRGCALHSGWQCIRHIEPKLLGVDATRHETRVDTCRIGASDVMQEGVTDMKHPDSGTSGPRGLEAGSKGSGMRLAEVADDATELLIALRDQPGHIAPAAIRQSDIQIWIGTDHRQLTIHSHRECGEERGAQHVTLK
eukprot:CAMPEP_0181248276 /NCGR_PEP_ID=MMETSP1096-20121128/45076_1 /TAXON_ID=156174 ORGANISM="Chrysochromulina ericina, Strain CCMP281" /NCGR_SAMPLE_ID=MMETSP1096 /ASSEMBLY_ACC=CAM_ASM_000453 /LENGTH=177 /DNA_ID=CAMNT_0023345419 /DNA_START=123 /DNA_END=657 /DNA_ORIENTATION=+